MPTANCQLPTEQHGFTLVEMSIALVIIGLIAAGIVGSAIMLSNAEIRNMQIKVSQIELGISTFKSKYNGLPGDLPNAHAFFGADIGCTNAAVGNFTGTGCNGNGDGRIQYNGAEFLRAFQQLSLTSLLPDKILMEPNLATIAAATSANGYLPTGPRNAVWSMWCNNGSSASTPCPYMTDTKTANRIHLTSTSNSPGGVDFNSNRGGVITPIEAFNWDTKVDDGLAMSGKFVAYTANGYTSGVYGVCGPPWTDYQTGSAIYKDQPGCAMWIGMNY